MRLTQHPTNNGVLGAPPGLTREECRAAPITRFAYANGQTVVRTYWRPTREELDNLMAGGLVSLEVHGSTMPPVILTSVPLRLKEPQQGVWDDGRPADCGA